VVRGDLTGSLFRSELDIEGGITRLTRGFQLQQSLRLRGGLELYAGYRYKRTSTLAATLTGDPIDAAGVSLSLVQTTYDNLLDPVEGRFLSANLELDPKWLGSDAPFVKGFAQLAFVRSFASRSLTWAQGLRLGLARASGGEPVHPFERFRVGGANSLRGFGTDQVGPRTPLDEPAGGEAVLVVNQELRYRHRSGLGAVVFYDGGNVYARPGDLGFGLRHSLGTGLRWASPVGLLRLDLGFPVDRQPGEESYRLFFSLGQAF
jgi:translocation and assembly module TamA